ERRGAPRAAQAVAPVLDEEGVEARISCVAMHDREIAAGDAVHAQLLLEAALGLHRPREDEDARRLFVEPLHRADHRIARSRIHPAERGAGLVDERVAVALLVGDGEDAGRLVDDHHVGGHVHDARARAHTFAQPRRAFVDLDLRAGSDPRGRIERAPAVDPHPPARAELSRLAPRQPAELADDGRDRRSILLGRDAAGLAAHYFDRINPRIEPSASTSTSSAAGLRGRPGMVITSPISATKKPAPALKRTSRTVTRKPAGRPSLVASSESERKALATQIGRSR